MAILTIIVAKKNNIFIKLTDHKGRFEGLIIFRGPEFLPIPNL